MARFPATSPLALVIATTTALLSAACFDTSSTITTADYPTRLTVDPLLFRGALPCGAPGLERYVVALYDVTSGQDPNKRVTSSGPVVCQNLVTFGEPTIVSTHFYKAFVDGYDRNVEADPADDDPDASTPRMVEVGSGEAVSPKWRTTCGEVPPRVAAPDAEIDTLEDAPPYNHLRYPTQVLLRTEVILHGCLPLASAMPDASTDDGSSGGGDAADSGAPAPDASVDGTDAAEPDSGRPDDDAADGSEAGEGGADDGGAD
jgi:hypothetical protein